jgi:hypothetical protein
MQHERHRTSARKKICVGFIVITGYVDDFTYDRMIEEGANDFIYSRLPARNADPPQTGVENDLARGTGDHQDLASNIQLKNTHRI